MEGGIKKLEIGIGSRTGNRSVQYCMVRYRIVLIPYRIYKILKKISSLLIKKLFNPGRTGPELDRTEPEPDGMVWFSTVPYYMEYNFFNFFNGLECRTIFYIRIISTLDRYDMVYPVLNGMGWYRKS